MVCHIQCKHFLAFRFNVDQLNYFVWLNCINADVNMNVRSKFINWPKELVKKSSFILFYLK